LDLKKINKKLPEISAIDFGLKLGMSPDELFKKFGKPTMDQKEGKKELLSMKQPLRPICGLIRLMWLYIPL
jgi:hypothetical protein